MNPEDYRQLPSNQPLSSGRDWQAEAVYGAMHPDYNPTDPNLRPVPSSQPTAPLSGDAPHMPGSNEPMPLPSPEGPSQQPPQQPPAAQPYTPPVSYTPPRSQQQAPNYQAYSSMKKRRWPAIVLIVVIVALLGGAGYTGYQTFFAKDKQTTTNTPPGPSPSPGSKPTLAPTDAATLSAVVLSPPSDMKGFTAKDASVASVKSYADASGMCTLQFGTLPADRLPGGAMNEIVTPQLDALKKAGATVSGPHTEGVLILKDATDANVSYTMPTVRITFVDGTRHARSHYSIAILKSGTRAFASRSCVNPDGTVDQKAFDAVEAKAKQLTITKQL